MALTITLGSERVPHVRIVIPGTDLTSGALWELWASYTDGLGDVQSYRVRGASGVPASAQVVLVDVAAPLNTTVTYSLTVDGTVTVTGTTTRTYTGRDVLQGVDGDEVVDFNWLAAGGDPREPVVRVHVTDVPGSPRPPARLAPVLGAGGGSILADTSGVDTAAMRRLLGRPCYVLHNPSRCTIPGCDIPPSELVLITRAGNDRSDRIDAAHRHWNLEYLLIADPEPSYRVPVSTWGDAEGADLTWGEAATVAATWGAAELVDWSTVGV